MEVVTRIEHVAGHVPDRPIGVHHHVRGDGRLVAEGGEVLDVDCPGLSEAQVINKGAYVVPLGNGQFRVGATYRWPPFAAGITEDARQELSQRLEAMTSEPFRITEQRAAGIKHAKDQIGCELARRLAAVGYYVVLPNLYYRRTREFELKDAIDFGASPRATLFLSLAARAHAFLRHRGFVTPEDVKAVGMDVLRHRVTLTYEAEAEELTPEQVVQRVFDKVEVP